MSLWERKDSFATTQQKQPCNQKVNRHVAA